MRARARACVCVCVCVCDARGVMDIVVGHGLGEILNQAAWIFI